MYKNIHYLVILVCIYSAWLDSDMHIRSFVQGAMPVVIGLVIGQKIGHYLGNERIGALTCASTAAFLDHHLLKGHKDRHAVARKLGNAAPITLALLCYYSRMATSCDQVGQKEVITPQASPYDTLRMYVFNAQERSKDDSFNDFYPNKTNESLHALVQQLKSVKKQDSGLIRVDITMGKVPIVCPVDQSLARELLVIYDQINVTEGTEL